MRFNALLLFAVLTLAGLHGCRNKVEELPNPNEIESYVAVPHEIKTYGDSATVNLATELNLKPGMRLDLGKPRNGGSIYFNDQTGQFKYFHNKVMNAGLASRSLLRDTIDYKVCQNSGCSGSSIITFRVVNSDSCRLQPLNLYYSVDAGQKLTFHLDSIVEFCPKTFFNTLSSQEPNYLGNAYYNKDSRILTINVPPNRDGNYIISIKAKTTTDSVDVQFHITAKSPPSLDCQFLYQPQKDIIHCDPNSPTTEFNIRDLLNNDISCSDDGGIPRSFRIIQNPLHGGCSPIQDTTQGDHRWVYRANQGSLANDSLLYEIKSRSHATRQVKLLFIRQ